MKLKLKKDIVENKELSNNAIIAYLGVVSCLRYGYDYIFTNKNLINYYLTNKTTMARRFEENIRHGLNELIDNNIITCQTKIGTDFYFKLNNIQLEKEDKFVFIDVEDIHKILNCNYQGKSGLLRFYLCLLSTFLSKNTVQDVRDPNKFNNILGMMSQEYLSELSGMSPHSIVEYTKILENLGLIYVYRCSFVFRDADGTVKRHNNIYGKYKDKEIIDDFVKIKYEMYDDLHKKQSNKIANSYRSLMQKYNCLCNGISYDEKTIENVFKYIVNYNNKNPKKEKDLTVFRQYGYVID